MVDDALRVTKESVLLVADSVISTTRLFIDGRNE
jgi:hypothetical protein